MIYRTAYKRSRGRASDMAEAGEIAEEQFFKRRILGFFKPFIFPVPEIVVYDFLDGGGCKC